MVDQGCHSSRHECHMQVRSRVRSSGMKGMDAGLMCGFGVGYGFGAGLVLKPSALQAMQRRVQELSRTITASSSGPPLINGDASSPLSHR